MGLPVEPLELELELLDELVLPVLPVLLLELDDELDDDDELEDELEVVVVLDEVVALVPVLLELEVLELLGPEQALARIPRRSRRGLLRSMSKFLLAGSRHLHASKDFTSRNGNGAIRYIASAAWCGSEKHGEVREA
jgi:hypothetical protein